MDYPFLSESRIETAAARLRVDAFGLGHEVPMPLDLGVILFDHLYEKEGLAFSDDTDLGYQHDDKVLGKTLPLRRRILIDRSLKEDPAVGRYRFTVAHEIGHWVLHRHLFERDPLQGCFLTEASEAGEYLVSLHRDVFPGGPRDRLPPEEWQANRFAIALLLEPDRLRQEFRERFGRSCLTTGDLEQPASRQGLRLAARVAASRTAGGRRSLADLFAISRESMAIALEERGYVLRTPPLV